EEVLLSYGLLSSLIASTPTPSTDPLTAGAELLVSFGATDDPLVVVVDDLQWADSKSASALRFALRRLLAEPVLVVLSARPHPEDTLGDAWARLLSDSERVVRVHLDGLTTDGMLELVAATGHGAIERSTAERLREHTQGNPLYARALVDELGDGRLHAPGVLPAPRSFAQLTAVRLAGLDDDAQRLVIAGAV